MDEQLVHKMINKTFGFYSCSIDCGFKLTQDCADLATLLERTVEEISGKELAQFTVCVDNINLADEFECQLKSNGEIEQLITFLKKDGKRVCVLNRGVVEKDSMGNEYVRNIFVCAEKTCRLIDQLKDSADSYRTKLSQKESEMNLLQTCAEQDSLTRIFNAGTTRRLSEEYIYIKENSCAMLVIDVDDFKRVNDRYGHMVGDEVMISAASAIKKLFRANDIVGRIGGDEFLVLMKDIPTPGIVSLRCSQIIEAFNSMRFDSMKNERISCSVGAAVSGEEKMSYDEMFLCADKAMYRAKSQGGNGYIVDECK